MPQVSLSEFADKINEYMPVIINGVFRRNENELFRGKITMPQFLVLSFLLRQGQTNMTALARYLDVSTPAVTGIVERLVRDAYAVRGYDAKDRRVIKIQLTAKGNELVKRINRQKRLLTIKVFGKLPAGDRQNYLQVMTKIKDILSHGS